MMPADFDFEILRLRRYFNDGDKVFSTEKLKLIWPVVRDLPPKSFKAMVDTMIGNNGPAYPPRLVEFQEMAAEQRRLVFKETAQLALGTVQRKAEEPGHDGLKKALSELGVQSLMEAIQKRKTGGI